MPLIQHHISPEFPTLLADHASVDLPGQDLFLTITQNVHIVQTRLDVTTFEKALSKSLRLYPHAAGQLRSGNDLWSIELTNTPVPVDIEYRIDTISDTFLDGDWVVQDDLSPFLSPGSISRVPVDDGDAHLLRLKLTFFENETSIGISWHHALGDATVVWRFMHTLSQFYQELPPECPPPTFEKYHYPTPSPSMLAELQLDLPHIHDTFSFGELRQLYIKSLRDFRDLKWRIDNNDLDDLRSALSSHTQNDQLSKQDCLSAYVVAVLNHASDKPVQLVLNVCSYRNVDAPFVNQTVAGNVVNRVPATVPANVGGIATALREALLRFRDPDCIYKMSSLTSNFFLQLANARRGIIGPVRSDGQPFVVVNSYRGIDWCSVHFGCPDGSRFFKTGLMSHWLRCFRSNPVKGDDGVWRVRQSVDISIGVRAELKQKLLEVLAHGFRYILDDVNT